MKDEVEQFLAGIRDERRRERRAAGSISNAVSSGDIGAFIEAVSLVESDAVWRSAFRLISRSAGAPPRFRKHMIDFWVSNGDSVRLAVGDDLIVARALRRLLPPYEGPAVKLFRGEGAANRKRRTYGVCWSSDRSVAESFARNNAARYRDGTVLLCAVVPAEGVISSVHRFARNNEQEYLVDRTYLARVKLLKRFAPDGIAAKVTFELEGRH